MLLEVPSEENRVGSVIHCVREKSKAMLYRKVPALLVIVSLSHAVCFALKSPNRKIRLVSFSTEERREERVPKNVSWD